MVSMKEELTRAVLTGLGNDKVSRLTLIHGTGLHAIAGIDSISISLCDDASTITIDVTSSDRKRLEIERALGLKSAHVSSPDLSNKLVLPVSVSEVVVNESNVTEDGKKESSSHSIPLGGRFDSWVVIQDEGRTLGFLLN